MDNKEPKKVFLLWCQQSGGYDKLCSLLDTDGWRIISTDGIRLPKDWTQQKQDLLICLGIFDLLEHNFSPVEIKNIEQFYSAGHSLIVTGAKNGDQCKKTNLNHIVSRFGVKFNEDCVIRPNPYKHYHPTEAQLDDFVTNRGLTDSLRKYLKFGEGNNSDELWLLRTQKDATKTGPRLLYPDGCTLKVDKSSTVMMTTSQWALPNRQAICAFHKGQTSSRFIAIGSSEMMADNYIDREDNKAIIKTLIDFIVNKNFPINISDAKTIEIPELVPGPDVNQLIDVPISCINESEPLPKDKSSLIDKRYFTFDGLKIPLVIRAYKDLDLVHEPLTLVKPSLECKLLSLEPATHGFTFRRPE